MLTRFLVDHKPRLFCSHGELTAGTISDRRVGNEVPVPMVVRGQTPWTPVRTAILVQMLIRPKLIIVGGALAAGCATGGKGSEPHCTRPSIESYCADGCPPTPADAKDEKYWPSTPLVFRKGSATVLGYHTGHAGNFLYYEGDELVGYSTHIDIVGGPCPLSYVVGRQTIPLRELLLGHPERFEAQEGKIAPCTYSRELPEDWIPPIQCEPSDTPPPEFEDENTTRIRYHNASVYEEYADSDARHQLGVSLIKAMRNWSAAASRAADTCFKDKLPDAVLQGNAYINVELDADHIVTGVYARHFFPEPRFIRCVQREMIGKRLSGTPAVGSFTVETYLPFDFGVHSDTH